MQDERLIRQTPATFICYEKMCILQSVELFLVVAGMKLQPKQSNHMEQRRLCDHISLATTSNHLYLVAENIYFPS